MLSKIPIDLGKAKAGDVDKEILRAAIIAELDAVNLYEQMAALARDKHIRLVLLDIAKEEKTHVGEFQEMLLRLDKEQVKEFAEAKKEIKEITGK
jgi:rubrerythrin